MGRSNVSVTVEDLSLGLVLLGFDLGVEVGITFTDEDALETPGLDAGLEEDFTGGRVATCLEGDVICLLNEAAFET